MNLIRLQWTGSPPRKAVFASAVLKSFDMDQCAIAHVLDERSHVLRAVVPDAALEAVALGQLRLRPEALGSGRDVRHFFRGVRRLLKYSLRGFTPPTVCWRQLRQGLGSALDAYESNEPDTCASFVQSLIAFIDETVMPLVGRSNHNEVVPCRSKWLAKHRKRHAGAAISEMCDRFPEMLAVWAQQAE